jgi:hypothetical protein
MFGFRNNLCLVYYAFPAANSHRTTITTPTMPVHHRSKKLVSSTTREYSGLRFGGSKSSKVVTAAQVRQRTLRLEEKRKEEENREFQRHLRY